MTHNTHTIARRACRLVAHACAVAALASVTAVTPTAQTQQPLNPAGGQPGGPRARPNPGGPLTQPITPKKLTPIKFVPVPVQFFRLKFPLGTGRIWVFN